jgi:hypothetical protein
MLLVSDISKPLRIATAQLESDESLSLFVDEILNELGGAFDAFYFGMDYFNVDNQIKELVKLKLYPSGNFETTTDIKVQWVDYCIKIASKCRENLFSTILKAPIRDLYAACTIIDPNFINQVVASKNEYVSIIRKKLDFFNGKLLLGDHLAKLVQATRRYIKLYKEVTGLWNPNESYLNIKLSGLE